MLRAALRRLRPLVDGLVELALPSLCAACGALTDGDAPLCERCEGTLDPVKTQNAADNALVGNADDVAQQICDRFHPDDRLMLWFDFFNHDAARVIADMEAFMTQVVPKVRERVTA